MGSCFELCSLQPPGALSCAVQTCGVSELAWPRVEPRDTTGLKIALGLAVLAEGTLRPHVVPRGEVPDSMLEQSSLSKDWDRSQGWFGCGLGPAASPGAPDVPRGTSCAEARALETKRHWERNTSGGRGEGQGGHLLPP